MFHFASHYIGFDNIEHKKPSSLVEDKQLGCNRPKQTGRTLQGNQIHSLEEVCSHSVQPDSVVNRVSRFATSLDGAKEDALLAQKELEAHKNDVEAKLKNQEADYKDMYESMTSKVEEEQKKTKAAQKEADDAKAKFAEFEAQLKVKDAEIAEAKVRSFDPTVGEFC